MGKKVALNVLYNLGIFISVLFVYLGIKHLNFFYIAGALFAGTILVFLKIKLLGEVKAMKRPTPVPPLKNKKRQG